MKTLTVRCLALKWCTHLLYLTHIYHISLNFLDLRKQELFCNTAHANHICPFSTSFIVFIETLYHHKSWVLRKRFLWSTILSHLLLEELPLHTHCLPACDRKKERHDSCLHAPFLVLGLVRWRAIDCGFWWGTSRPFNFCHTIMVSSFMISRFKHNKHSKISWRMKNVRVGNFSSVKLTTDALT